LLPGGAVGVEQAAAFVGAHVPPAQPVSCAATVMP
jgi:hypothetical protein